MRTSRHLFTLLWVASLFSLTEQWISRNCGSRCRSKRTACFLLASPPDHLPRHRCVLEVASSLDFDSLIDMDLVIYSLKVDAKETKRLGAIQEDGSLAPLSVWTTEPVYDTALEFVVAEEDTYPGLKEDEVIIYSVIPQEYLYYGSRQVGGGKGLGNPHGEHAEMLYYVDQDALGGIELSVRPELEMTG